jgi:drug/metabolite transporter (DMT)-like permease
MPRLIEPAAPDLSASTAQPDARFRGAGQGVTAGVGAGVAFSALGAIAFSGKAIIVKLAFRHGADAITLIALRMTIALPFFAIMAWYAATRRGVIPLSKADRRRVVVIGFLGYYLASYLDFLGLEYVSASLERLILYLNPTLVLLIGLLFLGRRTNARQVAALLLGYAGMVLVFLHDFHVGGNSIALGSLLVLASALAYAMYLVGSGELVKRLGALRLTAYASCVASLFCMLQFALTRPLASLAAVPMPVYGLSLINATLCTVLPVFFVMLGISRLGASVASQIGMIGPVSTIVAADLLLDERMGPTQIAGTVLVMLGVFIVSQGRTPTSSAAPPEDRQQFVR